MIPRILAALLLMFAALAPAQTPFAGRRFVIDAGHGGTDPGAVGIDGGAYPNEEDFVLDVAQRLKTLLETAGAEVVMTRESDVTVSLTTRRDLTNAESPDAFLSIHCNSFSNATAHGTETFWWTSGNSADQSLAARVQDRMMEAFGLTNRGVKQAEFTVLTSNPPASLAEMMFISNQQEFDLMNTPSTRQAAADAFYRAFGDFLGINLDAPVIQTQPSPQQLSAGQNAVFSAVASGEGLSYQWLRNGVSLVNGGKISGATQPTLTIAGAQLADAGFYSLRVTGGGTTVTTTDAQLAILTTPGPAGSGAGLRGMFFDNSDFTALRRARVDATVNFNWGTGSPSSTVAPDSFSVRWTGQVEPRYSQTYRFYARCDDGVRLWVDHVLLIDHWQDQGATEWSGDMALTAGRKYDLRLEYYENSGAAVAELRWSSPSQLKEIIPASQLYRPPPVLAAAPPVFVLEGQPLAFSLAAATYDPVLSSQPWADFENEADGATDSVLFRKPHFSGSTSGFTDAAKPRETTVVSAFPSGNSSSRALHVKWSWASGVPHPWLRLTTIAAATLPNPVVDFRKSLRFDLWSEHTLKFAVGLRETDSTGTIGSDGGTAGAIEFAGVTGFNGGAPVPLRTVSPDAWRTLEFDLPSEPVLGFTGNGLLESSTGFGVLEHLCVVPGSGSMDHDVFLDNFVVVASNQLTYSLTNAPAGASIDSATGAIHWIPDPAQAGIRHDFAVQVTDAGSPPLTGSQTISVTAVPRPEIIAVSRNGNSLTFSWRAAASARYDVESAPSPAGPWTRLTTVTSAGPMAASTVTATQPRQFFRAKWLP
ncbi:MAG: N-acetylmuramoyl-L-alanine amidase [Verrucomicrobiales bacterium]|nr:N-acetylmuramoyl-L-alanine amidase [Verrucomicrobiales bacterium]